MMWWDYVLTGISVLCTVVSIVGAYRANLYYKKSKNISILVKTKDSLSESKIILESMGEILKLSNTMLARGKNISKMVSEQGQIINKALIRIKELESFADNKKIDAILKTKDFNAQDYINSLISGKVICDGTICIDNEYTNCYQIFENLQLFLKQRMEEQEEKLK